MKRTLVGEQLGKGVYGKVHVIEKIYAGKFYKYAIDASTLREVSILSTFRHPNIIGVYRICFVDKKLVLLMEKARFDIYSVMNNITLYHRPIIIQHVLNGLSFIHKKNIAHRDIKPQNILVFYEHDIKICDFGLASINCLSGKTNTENVVSLWYRAPEVILNPGKYDVSIDIWAVGVILLEMILKDKFPFTSQCEIYNLFIIFQLLGTPTEEEWNGLSKMEYWKDTFPKFTGNLQDLLDTSDASENEKDLLKRMLAYPNKRISADEALCHPYFNDYKHYLKKNVSVDITINKKISLIYTLEFYKNITVLFSWMYEKFKKFNMDKNTLFTAFNIFNTYITSVNCEKEDIYILGIICFDISCKLLEIKYNSFKEWSYECSDFYSTAHFKCQLNKMLKYFKFNFMKMIIIYKNELDPDLILLISCCMSNFINTYEWSFEKIMEICKMIFNGEKTEKTEIITSYIQDMEKCVLKDSVLKYINKNL